jgi:polysaccharide pyruvyl transferase WcaK-like protein
MKRNAPDGLFAKASRIEDCVRAKGGKIKSIGLWGHNGGGNLGNEAGISAVIQNLRRLGSNIDFYGFSVNPDDTEARHGIRSFPIKRWASSAASSTGASVHRTSLCTKGWKARVKSYPVLYRVLRRLMSPVLEIQFLLQAHRSLKDIDLMLVAGTGQVADTWGGAGNFPYSLFKWSHLCRIRGVKWAVVSSGAGPISSSFSKPLIKSALSGSVYRSFRDEHSKRVVENLGVNGKNYVYPDLVFSLDLSGCGGAARQERAKTVVINALPFRRSGSWENPDGPEYSRYLDGLAKFACRLMEEGYEVRLVPTQLHMDRVFFEDLEKKSRENPPKETAWRLIAQPADSFEEVIAQLSQASLVVTSRFHGVVFSYMLGKPVLAISYHPKIRELMKNFGQERFCIDVEALDCELMVKKFRELESVKDEVSRQVLEKAEVNKRLLDEQYRRLLEV